MKVVHLTSVHNRRDIRIFLKQCKSLTNYNMRVTLVVADGKGSETVDAVDVIDIGTAKNRLDRILNIPKRMFGVAIDLDADIYHFHDPELLPLGLKLKKKGKRVIFDSHEDVPEDILTKEYLPAYLRKTISFLFKKYEKYVCLRLDGVVAATPFIRDKFLKYGINAIDINNYPLLGELSIEHLTWADKERKVAYVGGITELRGVVQVVEAFSFVKDSISLELAGQFTETDVYERVKRLEGWGRVHELGQINRVQVKDILSKVVGGLVTFLPVPNHIDAQPNKMFEYMSAGVPVIASNFPLWKEIIEGNQCGICVDPLNPQAIADAVNFLVEHPVEAEKMGNNGQRAVIEKYNWTAEESKLVRFYQSLVEA